MRELRLAVRTAGRRPWLTASMVGLIGGALAVNTALYSAVRLFVLRDLPARNATELVVVESELNRPVSQATLDILQTHPAFTSVAAVVAGNESPSDAGVYIARATPTLSTVLGVSPARGRWLSEDEPNGVVISWSLWQARFRDSAGLVGSAIDVGGRRRPLMGVMPLGFDFPAGSNVWELAPRLTGTNYTRYASLTAIARLREGTKLAAIEIDNASLMLVPFVTRFAPSRPQSLILLLVGALLVLSLTVLHLAAFGLTQVTRYRTEAALRLALGAEPRHLVRQALADSAVPVVGGLALALALTFPIQAAAGRWLPPELLRGSALSFDWKTFAFGSALAGFVLVTISAAWLPAIPWRRPKEALSAGTARATGKRTNRVVLTMQTACAVALIYLCSQAVANVRLIQSLDLGFSPSSLMVVHLPWGSTPLDVQRSLMPRVDESANALRLVPGVVEVAATMAYPFSSFRGATRVKLADNSTAAVELPHIGPGYLELIGAKFISGRGFSKNDVTPPPLYAVINRSLATAASSDGIPRLVDIGGLPHEVVGVVDDVRMWRPDLPAGFQAYVSTTQRRAPASAIVVRTSSDVVAPALLSAAIQHVWPGQPVRVESVPETIYRLTAPQRTRAALLSGLAIIGVILTAGALAGGLAEGVRSRRREIALRMALGASHYRLIQSVVGEALAVVVLGLFLGLPLGVAAQHMLPEIFSVVTATDVRTTAIVALTLILVAIIGSLRPAVIACSVDPAEALGSD